MEFSKIAEILGANFLLIVNGVLIGIVTIETVVLWELAYRMGGLRRLFSHTAKIYNHRINNPSNKRNKSAPIIKEKRSF